MRCFALAGLAGALFGAAGTSAQLPLKVESGSASFNAGTTVPGVEVTGKSNALSARVEIATTDTSISLRHIDATLPAKSLSTGMKVRDEHMRKYIFQDPSGELPDLRFTSERATCPAATHAFECFVAGEFQMRGLSRPFQIALRVKQQSETSFHVEGDGILKLTDYGIEPPSQFGVRMLNEVKFHIDFKISGDRK